ncbi:hypothetical protein G3I24_29720, partial [Micromonospora aurantiaca]|nr:hypothetical protein [Micromonospora aurantiaca]
MLQLPLHHLWPADTLAQGALSEDDVDIGTRRSSKNLLPFDANVGQALDLERRTFGAAYREDLPSVLSGLEKAG